MSQDPNLLNDNDDDELDPEFLSRYSAKRLTVEGDEYEDGNVLDDLFNDELGGEDDEDEDDRWLERLEEQKLRRHVL